MLDGFSGFLIVVVLPTLAFYGVLYWMSRPEPQLPPQERRAIEEKYALIDAESDLRDAFFGEGGSQEKWEFVRWDYIRMGVIKPGHPLYEPLSPNTASPIGQSVKYLRSLPYTEYLKSGHWATKRKMAMERADHRCQLCNSAEHLQVHHRTYERLGEEQDADLTVLCDNCHSKFHRFSL